MQVKKSWIVLGVLILLVLMGYGMVKGTYNGFVVADEAVAKSWSDVESTYQRRADLIPNLVETVKGYAAHEKETFTEVTNARAKVGQTKVSAQGLTPEAIQAYASAQQGLGGALSRLLVVAERYPDLKASANFADLQVQLEGTENRINVARTRFNEASRTYNTKIRTFPANLFAGAFGFGAKPYFEAEEGSEAAPEVKF